MTAFHGTPGTPTPNQMVYASNLPGNQNFELDLGGNMTSGNQQVFGVDNRLRSTASSFLGIGLNATRFEYDRFGHITKAETETSLINKSAQSYNWDTAGELTAVVKSHSNVLGTTIDGSISYAYDALGREIAKQKIDNSGNSPVTVTTGSLYIGDSRLIDFDLTTAKITRSYLVEMQGNEPITAIVAGVAEPVWMLGDHAGSTRSLATYGNSQWSIVHLPFSEYGTPLTVIPNTMIATSTIAMLGQIPKFWQGNQYDTDVGLYRINGRVYSPLVGRYIEPVAGGAVAGATNP